VVISWGNSGLSKPKPHKGNCLDLPWLARTAFNKNDSRLALECIARGLMHDFGLQRLRQA
jgi:hypothetical protein